MPLARALKAGDWSNPAFADPAVAVTMGRRAYEAGRITEGQFATLVLRWEALWDFNVPPQAPYPVQMLDAGGSLTFEARRLTARMEPDMQARFEALVRSLPVSERMVWILTPAPRVESYLRRYRGSPLDETFQAERLGWNNAVVVPSFGLLQAGLDARYGEDAMRLKPVFGVSGIEEIIADVGAHERVIGLSYPDGPEATLDDGVDVGHFGFSNHDYSHADGGSKVPRAYRAVLPRVHAAVQAEGLSEGFTPSYLAKLSDLTVNGAWEAKEPGWLGKALSWDFSHRIVHAIARDMARRPEAWPGLDVAREVDAMGELARGEYRKALPAPERKGNP